jgi:hypothetical protein
MQVRRVAAIVFALAVFSTPAIAQVQMTINGGRVSISAKNATVGQILAEWARIGQTRIVNPERVIGSPLTLELTNVSELEALDILLRTAGGYVLAPRRVETANASQFDRILILPAGTGPRPAVTAAVAPAPPQRPQFTPPQFDDNDDPANGPPPPGPDGRPVFSTFPQPPQRPIPPSVDQSPANVPATRPTLAPGVSVPGMVAPVPAPPQGQVATPSSPQ